MKLIILIINSLVLLNTVINAVGNEYDVQNIPIQLLIDAGAVIRKDDASFEVEDYNSAYLKIKYAVTIFNKDEQGLGRLSLSYDKFRSIEELDGTIYNSQGVKVRELDNKDIKDYSDFENYTLYSDNRVKYVELYHDKFPYTVEFKYVYEYDGYLSWPSWYSRNNLLSIESTSFQVIVPKDYQLRFWCNNENIQPKISQQNDQKLFYWEDRNLPKLSTDIYGEDIEDVATIVHIAPSDFEIDGYYGNMNSWDSFGKWYYNLCKGKDILPEDVIKEIHDITSSASDEIDKIKVLYNFLQSRTRYVSIQLGIGSWQPLDATYVQKNGYGDCKALSNYMISLLKIAGIKAYPVLINSGFLRLPLIRDLPSNQFNHVIVCVPTEKDTIWLECTSQVIAFGKIGWSNENRDALMVTPEGGIVVKTPLSSSINNMQLKKLTTNISFTGNTEVHTDIKWLGNQQDYVIDVAERYSPEEKEKWIKKLFDVPDIKLNNYNFNYEDKNQNEVELQTAIILPRYGSVTGKRIFFNPNIMERRKTVPKKVNQRFSPVRFRFPYLDIDSVTYEIPNKYEVEAVPDEVEIKNSFGSFYSKTQVDKNGSILFVRSLEIKNYSIPAENYSEYQKFFAQIAKSDKQQIILIKKQ